MRSIVGKPAYPRDKSVPRETLKSLRTRCGSMVSKMYKKFHRRKVRQFDKTEIRNELKAL